MDIPPQGVEMGQLAKNGGGREMDGWMNSG